MNEPVRSASRWQRSTTRRFLLWLFSWRTVRRALLGLACLVTLIGLFYAEENWRGKHAWERHRQEWETKGEKFTVASLVPPPVPDDQNVALTPLLKSPLDYTRVEGRAVWRDTNAWRRLQNISANLQRGQTNRLTLGILEKGTFADLEACRRFYQGNTNYPQPVQGGAAAADILVALGKFDAEMKELREAAATRPLARFPIEYDYEPVMGILLPHLASMKGLCTMTHVRAIARLELRQSQEAIEELKLGFRLSDSFRDEPFLIDHLVRIATVSINLQTVREGLVRHAWSDAQLAGFEKHLASVNVLAEYKLGMRGERALSTGGLDWMRRQGFRIDMNEFSEISDSDPSAAKVFSLMPGGWYYQNMLTLSHMYQDFALPVVDEKAHRVFPDLWIESEKATEAMCAKRYHPNRVFAALLFPAVTGAVMKSARMQTYVDMARVGCALEGYRLANGKLPETLAALAPRFVGQIPNDVIDGKPLRYRRTPDGGCVVYSIGWNKTDDGGELGWTKREEPTVDLAKGDWVWAQPEK